MGADGPSQTISSDHDMNVSSWLRSNEHISLEAVKSTLSAIAGKSMGSTLPREQGGVISLDFSSGLSIREVLTELNTEIRSLPASSFRHGLASVRAERSATEQRIRSNLEKHSLSYLISFGHQKLIDAAMTLPRETADYAFRLLFPERITSDLKIRVSRFWDFKSYFPRARVVEILTLLDGMTYIWALCSAYYLALLPEANFALLKPLFSLTMDQFDKYAARLTNKLKASTISEPWEQYAEVRTLTGYRLVPWPGFDLEKEARDLAVGGRPDPLMPNGIQEAVTNITRDIPPLKLGRFQSFYDWLKEGAWVTTGSASFGSMELQFPSGDAKVSVSKNMLLDVVSLNQLYDDCISNRTIVNKAFVKEEAGKLRLAVSGDIYTYLKMRWVCDMAQKPYYHIPSTRRNETLPQKFKRMIDTSDNCASGMWFLPFDYSAFDHQVNTFEIQTQWKSIGLRAQSDPDSLSDPLLVTFIDDIYSALEHDQVITVPNSDPTKPKTIIEQKGGLSSGLFITSVCGDMSNAAWTSQVLRLCDLLGVQSDQLLKQLDIMGDDTNLGSYNPFFLQLLDLLIRAEGLEAATGKFGILPGRTEFLRVSYSKYGAKGYMARAIVSLIQRKPWSKDPLNPLTPISSHLSALATVFRRRGISDDFWARATNLAINNWCSLKAIDPAYATTATWNGGLGLGPALDTRRHYHYVPPALAVPTFHVDPNPIRNDITETAIQAIVPPEALKSAAILLANSNRDKLYTSVPTSASSSRVNEQYTFQFKQAQKHTRPTQALCWHPDLFYSNLSALGGASNLIQSIIDESLLKKTAYFIGANDYGSHQYYQRPFFLLKQLLDLGLLTNLQFSRQIQEQAPSFWRDYSYYSAKLTPTLAQDWLFGTFSVYTAWLNPIISPLIAAAISHIVHPGNTSSAKIRSVFWRASSDFFPLFLSTRFTPTVACW